MSKVCAATGKRPRSGNNVSHSNRKTKRRFLPNLQWHTLIDPETKTPFRTRISAHGLKIVSKNPRKLLELARANRK